MTTWSKKISSWEEKKIVGSFTESIKRNKKNKYLKFFYRQNELTISLFTNNTLLLQGNQKEIEKFKRDFLNLNYEQENNFSAKFTNHNESYIGCDEVGVGDYYGPVVTCACYLEQKNFEIIKNLSITDSKLISNNRILKLFEMLSNKIKYQATICNNKTYNQLHRKYKNNKIILAFLHNKTLVSLKNSINNSSAKVIMDEFTSSQVYDKYLKLINPKNVAKVDFFQIKAERKFLAVACASIFARALFLLEIRKMEKKIKRQIPLGAVKKEKIINLGKFLLQHGQLDEFAKLDFKPITNEIISK